MSEKEPTDYDVTSHREERVADPTTSAGEAPMYVPPNSAPVLQSLIAEAAALGHWALHEQLCGVLASVDAERRRHAEEVAEFEGRISRLADCARNVADDRDSLREQLRKVEGERDRMQRANETLAVRMDLPASQLLMVGSELCGDGKIDPNDHRDPRWTPTLQRAAEVMRELTARRALDADVMACAERCRDTLIGPPGMPVEDYPLAPEALAARRILAADFLREGGE